MNIPRITESRRSFECPECHRSLKVEYENENGYMCRYIHCLKDVIIWKE